MYKIIKPIALIVVALLVSVARPQPVPTPTAAIQAKEDRVALYQALLDLTNPWTVMCIAAHPDDEDGTSLIVMRRKFGAHTVSVFSTFGEGGQNAIGPELYEELGAIRARETMAAAEIQGSEPYFLGLKDFGYSKSADEAFRVWGHAEALRRMVLQIRKLRPDVIITNHSVTNNDHGHHQATARLALEAFEAAADPKRFPEQLKGGVTVWQVQRLFVRAGRNVVQNTGQKPDREGGLVTIDPNERDPIRDTVFAEEALGALQKHATQGPWPKTFADMLRFRNSQDGKLPPIRYFLVREAKGAEALPKDSHNLLDGLGLPEEIAKQLAPLTIDGRTLTEFVDQRERVLGALLQARKSRNALGAGQGNDSSRANRINSLVDRALGLAAGLRISIAPTHAILVPNSTNNFLVTISNKGNLSPWVIATHSDAGDNRVERLVEIIDKRPYQIAPGKTDTLTLRYQVAANEPVTVPTSEHLYDGRILTHLATMSVYLRVNDIGFSLNATTSFDVAPAVEIADIKPSPVVLTPTIADPLDNTKNLPTRLTFKFSIKLINHQLRAFDGNLIAASSLADSRSDNLAVNLGPAESRTVTMSVQRPPSINLMPPGSNSIQFFLQNAKENLNSPFKTVLVFSTEAGVSPNLRAGYIRGFDFSLPNALAALGVESKELSVDEVKTADLQKYSTIIVDNRVYESQPELVAANQRLLDYAKDGGTLIVFYHKSFEWNPDPRRNRPQLAPYPLILGDERITDENAPVTFIEAEHPLLNFPNKIGSEDFAGWIQERGLYYPKDWDANYHALLSTNDPGEAPLKGGLLVADYGRGHYIYTSMVWYRQLRAGVPGAYRMLANMVSYGHR